MLLYRSPRWLLFAIGILRKHRTAIAIGILLFLLAVIAIPGNMSHYRPELDPREILDPSRAPPCVRQGGRVVAPCMLVSFLGLLGTGVGFLFSSVWFWQRAAFSFANVFTQRFDLDGREQ